MQPDDSQEPIASANPVLDETNPHSASLKFI